MTSPTTLFFDVDGTLFRPAMTNEDRLDAAFAAVGVEPFCTVDELRWVVPTVDAGSLSELLDACLRTLATERGYSPAVAEQVAQAVELPSTAAGNPIPSAGDVLSTLHEQEYTLGVVTNGPEALQREKLRRVGFDEYFDTMVCGQPERGLKPAHAPFETALDALGSTPAPTVTIGDSYTADIEPAHALGMTTVWLTHSPPDPQPAPAADFVVQSLRLLLTEPWQ